MFSPSCPTAPMGAPSRHRLGPAGDPVEISPPAGLGSSDPGPVPPLGWGLVVEMMQAPHVKAALDEIGAATWCLPNELDKRRQHLLRAIYNLDLAVRCGECVDRSGPEAAKVVAGSGRSAHGQPIGASEAPGEGSAVACAGGPTAEVTDPPSASRSPCANVADFAQMWSDPLSRGGHCA